MNLQQLKYFTVLAEVGHFGRAAEQLHITQPALSNSIKGLERELGSDLFERTGRKAVLTPYGMRFIPHIIKALGEIEQASSLSPTPKLDNPSIHIATVASVQQTFLPALLIDYAEEAHKKFETMPATFRYFSSIALPLPARTFFKTDRPILHFVAVFLLLVTLGFPFCRNIL